MQVASHYMIWTPYQMTHISSLPYKSYFLQLLGESNIKSRMWKYLNHEEFWNEVFNKI